MIKCVFVNNTISKLKSFSITYNFWDVIKTLIAQGEFDKIISLERIVLLYIVLNGHDAT